MEPKQNGLQLGSGRTVPHIQEKAVLALRSVQGLRESLDDLEGLRSKSRIIRYLASICRAVTNIGQVTGQLYLGSKKSRYSRALLVIQLVTYTEEQRGLPYKVDCMNGTIGFVFHWSCKSKISNWRFSIGNTQVLGHRRSTRGSMSFNQSTAGHYRGTHLILWVIRASLSPDCGETCSQQKSRANWLPTGLHFLRCFPE